MLMRAKGLLSDFSIRGVLISDNVLVLMNLIVTQNLTITGDLLILLSAKGGRKP